MFSLAAMLRDLLRPEVVQPDDPHRVKVALIGAPNAGKSTLLNQLLKWKVKQNINVKIRVLIKTNKGILNLLN